MKTAVIVISDTHVNSTVALCPPEFVGTEGNKITANQPQLVLWKHWENLISIVDRLRREKWRIILIHLGDIAEFDEKQRSFQLMRIAPNEITEMATKTLEPLVRLSDRQLFIKGTIAHTGKGGVGDADIAGSYENVIPCGISPLHEFAKIEIEGVPFDLGHTSTMGALPWTRQTAAINLMNRVLHEYMLLGQRMPAIILRGHNHRWACTPPRAFRGRDAKLMPGWSLATEYINSKNPGAVGEIGAVIYTCANGKWDCREIDYPIKEGRTAEWIKIV